MCLSVSVCLRVAFVCADAERKCRPTPERHFDWQYVLQKFTVPLKSPKMLLLRISGFSSTHNSSGRVMVIYDRCIKLLASICQVR